MFRDGSTSKDLSLQGVGVALNSLRFFSLFDVKMLQLKEEGSEGMDLRFFTSEC